jgi:hypothetical protein
MHNAPKLLPTKAATGLAQIAEISLLPHGRW